MNRILSLLVIALVAILLPASALAKGAKVTLAEKSFDFGTVKQTDKAVTHTFKIGRASCRERVCLYV